MPTGGVAIPARRGKKPRRRKGEVAPTILPSVSNKVPQSNRAPSPWDFNLDDLVASVAIESGSVSRPSLDDMSKAMEEGGFLNPEGYISGAVPWTVALPRLYYTPTFLKMKCSVEVRRQVYEEVARKVSRGLKRNLPSGCTRIPPAAPRRMSSKSGLRSVFEGICPNVVKEANINPWKAAYKERLQILKSSYIVKGQSALSDVSMDNLMTWFTDYLFNRREQIGYIWESKLLELADEIRPHVSGSERPNPKWMYDFVVERYPDIFDLKLLHNWDNLLLRWLEEWRDSDVKIKIKEVEKLLPSQIKITNSDQEFDELVMELQKIYAFKQLFNMEPRQAERLIDNAQGHLRLACKTARGSAADAAAQPESGDGELPTLGFSMAGHTRNQDLEM